MERDKKVKKEKILRQPMPEQAAAVRAKNFEEVPTGYSPETAMKEAQRCLQCKKPACVEGCPVGVNIPEFIKLVQEGEFAKAITNIWTKNGLPAVCGRVCPQELQCEGNCIIGKNGDPVAIGNLERFAADYERKNRQADFPLKAVSTGKKVAVIGSGLNPLLTQATEGLALNKWGYIIADENTCKTSKQGIWAGGDIVTGSATVILAMRAGRKAADSIHDYLTIGW